MKTIVLVTLVAALPVHAGPAHALILTGAASEEAATPLFEAAKRRASAIPLLHLAEGFPRLVKSDTVKGLKPGLWIIVGGFCTEVTTLAALKAIEAGAYAKPVEVEDAGSCPKISQGWSATTLEAKDGEKRTLRGVLFTNGNAGENWVLHLVLRDKSGVVLAETKAFEDSASACLGAGDAELKVKGAALVVTTADCEMPRGCPNPGLGTASSTFTIATDKIEAATATLKTPGYGGCRGE